MKRLRKELDKRLASETFRKLKPYDLTHDFLSNDYLGLSRITCETDFFLSQRGSSRLIAGTSYHHLNLEEALAQKFKTEAALLFNAGYTANLGVLSCIPAKNDLILYDELAHASIKDGMRLSHAKHLKFKHNDTQDLARLLQLHSDNFDTIFVVVEGLYSMDGDYCPLTEICDLKNDYEFNLIVDEAHSAGTLGKEGKGLVYEEQLAKLVYLRIITFGKAFGSHGAAVLCDETTKTYLINFSRPFIYTTALPIQLVQDISTKINHPEIEKRQVTLQENISYFRMLFQSYPLNSSPTSPIQTLFFPKQDLKKIEQEATRKSIGVKAILPPTVPVNTERLRVSIHAFNTKKEIDLLHTCIAQSISLTQTTHH